MAARGSRNALAVRWLRIVCSITTCASLMAASTAAPVPEGALGAVFFGGTRPSRRRPPREPSQNAGPRRQALVFDGDGFGGVARGHGAFRHDHRDRLADKTHAADRERRLQLVED